MANATTNTVASFDLAAPFRVIGNFFVAIMEANSRVKQVEFLNSLSDEQLAARGLKRDEIVREVFKDAFYL
ncbi:hypothetical protein ACMU_12490 [Actibacterium mucosum KCTC 23349]|uniref:DUF1127 domain-containing protein n=1 Tax=Actibacterium mucosum KCTC 23349 TaxID=1454373 RepID=A0A037ZGD2_9RHOB|nr:hypothetical protein [Actibacterium mucosum]KAJ55505.1 hypothetical protein ACMU_12490 [Actibacterium mucosum KCTC 23349]